MIIVFTFQLSIISMIYLTFLYKKIHVTGSARLQDEVEFMVKEWEWSQLDV